MGKEKIRIIGCGNPLASDDCLGVYVIEELNKLNLPANVEAVAAGTDPLGLLDLIQNVKKAIIVDAVKGPGQPGKIYRLKPQDLENSEKSLSLHRLEIGQIIKLGQQLYPDRIADEIIIIGVEAEDLTPFKTGLSKTLKKTVPQVIEVVLTEIDL